LRGRHLSAEEHAIWARVARTARPLPGRELPFASASTAPDPVAPERSAKTVAHHRPNLPLRATRIPEARPRGDTLDGSWDKRIQKGDLQPDVSIDLHGETLATAHVRLNRGLDAAIRRGDRVVLLVTGKPAADNPRLPPTSRGVIRASIADWLAASHFSDRIAAIRNAHPRHGGAGALYIILRRPR